jgi:hypothetical protein
MLGLMVIGLPLIFWERERIVGAEEDFAESTLPTRMTSSGCLSLALSERKVSETCFKRQLVSSFRRELL